MPGELLSARERRIVEVLAETACPPGARLTTPPADAGVTERVSAMLGAMGAPQARGLRVMLWVLELWPLLTRGRRLSRLDAPSRLAALAAWHDSRLFVRRAAVRAVLGVVQLACWSTPAASAALAWRPAAQRLGE